MLRKARTAYAGVLPGAGVSFHQPHQARMMTIAVPIKVLRDLAEESMRPALTLASPSADHAPLTADLGSTLPVQRTPMGKIAGN